MTSHKILLDRLLLFALGMTAMATQVIMIRQCMALFNGNELIIGLFMGMWMVLTAIGSWLSSKFNPPAGGQSSKRFSNKKQAYLTPSTPHASMLIILALLPPATLFTLYFTRFWLTPAGVMAGLGDIVLVLLIVLAPFCVLSGMLFPVLVQSISVLRGKNLLHEGYALDSAGSILGGVMVSLVFIFILSPYENLLLLSIVFLCLAFARAWIYGQKIQLIIILTVGIAVMFSGFLFRPDRLLDRMAFKGQQVKEVTSSPFGEMAVTEIGKQINLYENYVPVVSGDDPITREESVDYAMLMATRTGTVLLISGGTGGTIDEILKYPVQSIDYLEFDPWMIKLIGKYKPFTDNSRVHFIFKDPRIFLQKSKKKYDVIILNTPQPNSAGLNRFYTIDFFGLLKEKLNPGGIVSLSVPSSGNYMNETSRLIHSVYYNTLKSVFTFVRIIPGWKDYYLASDQELDRSIFRNYDSLGFTNVYVNPSYINESLLKMRTDQIMSDLLPEAPVNSDLKPFVFSLYLKQWLERFKIKQWIIPLILILLLTLSLVFLGPLNLGLFTGGFTASSLEFILLIWFQVIFGFVYQMVGVIFAVFMGGLAIGSLFRTKIYKKESFKGFLGIQAMIALFSVLVTLTILLLSSSPLPLFSSSPLPLFSSSPFPIALIFFLIFITGLLTGVQFSLSAALRKSEVLKSSGESFSADLLGSAIGIVLVSVYVVPLLGLPVTALTLAGLNVLAIGVMAVKSR